MEYKILQCTLEGYPEFCIELQTFLTEGWSLQGGAIPFYNLHRKLCFSQTLTKETLSTPVVHQPMIYPH